MAFTKGLRAIKENINKATSTLKIKDGDSAVIRVLTPADEMIGLYEHVEQFGGNWRTVPCLGKDTCPLCMAGKRASYKTYLAVVDISDENKVKIFKASKTVTKQLIGLVEEYGDLTKRDFKVSRTGTKFDTTYQFFPRDPKAFDTSNIEMPDMEKVITPMSKEAILELMNGGVTTMDDSADTSSNEKKEGNGEGGVDEDGFPF